VKTKTFTTVSIVSRLHSLHKSVFLFINQLAVTIIPARPIYFLRRWFKSHLTSYSTY